MNRFYRYNSVCCPLKVFLIGKLDEKASALSLRAGRTGCIGFTDIIRSAVRLKFSLSENLMKNYRHCRFGRGGQDESVLQV